MDLTYLSQNELRFTQDTIAFVLFACSNRGRMSPREETTPAAALLPLGGVARRSLPSKRLPFKVSRQSGEYRWYASANVPVAAVARKMTA
jgi:hypothetical protein